MQFIHECYDENVTRRKTLPLPLPVSLTREDIPKVQGKIQNGTFVQYVVSPKADGVRVVLGVKNEVFCVDRSSKEIKVNLDVPNELLLGTLFDCELVGDTLWIFDTVRFCGHDTRMLAYNLRVCLAISFVEKARGKVEKWCAGNHLLPTFDFKRKIGSHWVAVKPLYYHTQVHEAAQCKLFPVDGLVFTPVTRGVVTFVADDTFKWKPPEQQTIDFLIQKCDHPAMVRLCYEHNKQLHEFQTVPIRADGLKLKPNRVYECAKRNGEWVLLHQRQDKTRPNSWETVQNVLKCIEDPVHLKDITPYLQE